MSLFSKCNRLGLVSKSEFSIMLGYVSISVDDDGNGEFGLKFPLYHINTFLEAIPTLEKVDKRLGVLNGYRVELPENFENGENSIEFPVPNSDIAYDEEFEISGSLKIPGPDTFQLIKDGDESSAISISVGKRTEVGEHCLLVLDDVFEHIETTNDGSGALTATIDCYKVVTIHILN